MAAANTSAHGQRRLALMFAATILAGAGSLTLPSAAMAWSSQTAPWCAYMGGGYGFDCSYFTFQQCMDTARGLAITASLIPVLNWCSGRSGAVCASTMTDRQ